MSIREVAWTRTEDNQTIVSPDLSNAEPGDYTVLITTEESCTYEGTFTLADEVRPYNGVSANGDGMNDFFHIDCISRYPNNKVDLYDRDGNLVFTQEGYDNLSKTFNGEGNTGLYLGGKQLPDGTYYYVIEKNDTTPMITGFIELIH